MSVLIYTKISGDAATFRKALTERAAEFDKISADARTKGAIHHRFGVGDGHIIIVDEWESAEQFQQFFGNPDLQAFVASAGGDTSRPPEIVVSERVPSSGEF
jgi:quinol monooxygenase YgiN